MSHQIFEYQINLLTDCGYRVVAVDLKGFILVGFSMGGAIALRYMSHYNGFGVCRLILLSAAAPCFARQPGFPYGKSLQEANDLIVLAGTDRSQLCQNFSRQLFANPHPDAVIEWFRDIALSASGIGTIKNAVTLRDENVQKDFDSVHVPTYIIHGEKDVIVSSELAEIQHQNICGSKLITLSDSGHGIVYDQLEEFNSVFMDSVMKF